MTQIVLPVALAAIAARTVWQAGARPRGRVLATVGIAVAALLWWDPDLLVGTSPWPSLVLLLAASACGAPIFAVLGGVAAMLLLTDGNRPVAILIETYALRSRRRCRNSAIHFRRTLLAEGQSSERLLQVS